MAALPLDYIRERHRHSECKPEHRDPVRRAVGRAVVHGPEEQEKRKVQQIEPEYRSGEKPDRALYHQRGKKIRIGGLAITAATASAAVGDRPAKTWLRRRGRNTTPHR